MTNTSQNHVILGRRQFLRAVGGGLVAMPFLQSLAPREAHSQTPRPKRFFVQMATGHGGVRFEHEFPSQATIKETSTYAGRVIRRGDLTPSVSGSTAALSAMLTASSARLTPRMASKMNVIAGLDIPYYIAHQNGAHLGNFAANDSSIGDPTPTIDQVMAYSPSFYEDLSGVLLRSMSLAGSGMPLSYNFADPVSKTGSIQEIKPVFDTMKLFNSVFVTPTSDSVASRKPVVDRVYESYSRLVQSNRQISSSDVQRLKDHMERLSELQRRSTVSVSCSGVQRPTKNAKDNWPGRYPGEAQSIEGFQLMNDVIVAAFLCGTSRIAVLGAHDQNYALMTDYVGSWHTLCHTASDGGDAGDVAAVAVCEAQRRFFEHVFLDLANKLDVDLGDGTKLLDKCLLVWSQESGHVTHDTYSIPVVTAGGAGGALRTGSFIDYRNLAISANPNLSSTYNPGLVWNQWLGTVLQAMGVPRSEFETPVYNKTRAGASGSAGYGPIIKFGNDLFQKPEHYVNAIGNILGEIPPYLRPA